MKRVRRLTAFLAKEILDVMRQPQLVAILVLGPFLILLVFGMGFTGQQAPVPIAIVIPEQAQIPSEIANRDWDFGANFPVETVTSDADRAHAMLEHGQVELVVQVPQQTYDTLLQGERITIQLFINAIDPIRQDYLRFVANSLINNINRDLARRVAREGQRAAERLDTFSGESLDKLDELAGYMEEGDVEGASQRLQELIEETNYTAGALDSIETYIVGLGATLGLQEPPELERLRTSQSQLLELRNELKRLQDAIETSSGDLTQYRSELQNARQTIRQVGSMTALFQSIPPDVLVTPLVAVTKNVSEFRPTYVGYYAPSVLALLVQHIAVTFAALSLVRDRLQGVNELFHVSPVGAAEALAGKFLSYMLLTLALSLILTHLILQLLDVPMYGNPLLFVIVLVLEIGASLGLGFLISAVSGRESQAVQLSMIALIASVLFSGFFLNLSGLRTAVLPISYSLPVTYGISSFQKIMLAGDAPPVWFYAALAGMALVLNLAAWVIYRRQFRLA